MIVRGPATCAGVLALGLVFGGLCEARAEFGTRVTLRALLEESRTQESELEFSPDFERRWGEGWSTRVAVRGRAAFLDRLEPGRPSQRERSLANRRLLVGDRGEIELREAFLRWADARTTVTLGKHELVWGEADGLKLLDVVNPQSFRQFILEPFEESRLPLWGAQVERAVPGGTLQLFTLLDPTYHELPEAGAVFAFSAPRFLPPLAPGEVFRFDPERPDGPISQAEFGARYTLHAGRWDLSVAALRGRNDVPAFLVEPGAEGLRVAPVHDRNELVGATASTVLGPLVLRSEVAWTFDEAFTRWAPGERRLPAETDVLRWMVGGDWYALGNGLITVQFFEQRMRDAIPGRLMPRRDRFATAALRKTFARDRMELTLTALANTTDRSELYRALLEYRRTDRQTGRFGLDVFAGGSDTVFGQFASRGRAYLELEWSI